MKQTVKGRVAPFIMMPDELLVKFLLSMTLGSVG